MAQFPSEAGNIVFAGSPGLHTLWLNSRLKPGISLLRAASPINPAKPTRVASLGFRGASGDFVFRALSREQKGK